MLLQTTRVSKTAWPCPPLDVRSVFAAVWLRPIHLWGNPGGKGLRQFTAQALHTVGALRVCQQGVADKRNRPAVDATSVCHQAVEG